jgi:hypothetical protein
LLIKALVEAGNILASIKGFNSKKGG